MARLFLSQGRLDTWTNEERVKVDGEIMTLVSDGRSFKLSPAVRFVKLLSGDKDPQNLLGKVKSVAKLKEIGGEHMEDSVIVGDEAYEVQSGFLGDPIAKD
jgi:hypothetical protein